MAQRRGSRIVDVGCRSLALACGLDDSTVALVLRGLREEADPVVEMLEPGDGERADRYSLRIPDAGLHAAAWRRWRAGNIEAVHPVFRELGAARALVHEALTETPVPRRDIGHDAALPPATVDEALRILAEHGLAERVPHAGWRRGPVHPDRLAETLGTTALVEGIVTRYRAERAAWRALLERRHLHRRPVVLGPGEALPWPVLLSAPPPNGPDEHAYDTGLSAVPETITDTALSTAVELLRHELGATIAAAG
jgi:CBS domain-containing protein